METEKITNKNPDEVSRYVFESATASMERAARKMLVIIILTLLAFIGTNAAWIIHFFF